MTRSALLLLVLLAGCASGGGWTKPGASSDDVNRDLSQCTAQAQAAAPPQPAPAPLGAAPALTQLTSPGPATDLNSTKRQQLTRDCMARRGYTAQ